jgi:FG-GAP-like repeat
VLWPVAGERLTVVLRVLIPDCRAVRPGSYDIRIAIAEDIGDSRPFLRATPDIDESPRVRVVLDKQAGVYWYQNPGNSGGNWIEHHIGLTGRGNGAHDVEVGDFNKDGKIDVAVSSRIVYPAPSASRNSYISGLAKAPSLRN